MTQVPAPLVPFTRTSAFYTKAWMRYLRRSRRDIPAVLPTPALLGHVFLDEVVLTGFRAVRGRGAALSVNAVDEIAEAAALFESRGWLDAPATFHETPPAPTAAVVRAVRGMRYTYEALSFDSGYEPHAGEPGRDRWLGYAPNRTMHAWMLRHDEPRPWLVCVHGAQMGRANIDIQLLRATWLHEELGLNVIMPIQPLHGPRAVKGAAYPGADMLDVVHGATQSVWDIRRVLAWIRAEDPDARIGLTGVSLGGYASSLVANFEPDLECVILGVPVSDIIGLIEHHAGAVSAPEWAEIAEPVRRLMQVVSPLALEPVVPHERRFMYAGLADRIVHPRHQITRLWEHWGRPEIHWYEGGHTLFFRSSVASRFVHAALMRSGLVDVPVFALTADE